MTYRELIEHCDEIDEDCEHCLYDHNICRHFYLVQGKYPFYFINKGLDDEIDTTDD